MRHRRQTTTENYFEDDYAGSLEVMRLLGSEKVENALNYISLLISEAKKGQGCFTDLEAILHACLIMPGRTNDEA